MINAIFLKRDLDLPARSRRLPGWIVRYGFAIGLCAAAIALTRMIRTLFPETVFDFFQGAVVLSAWYGGLGPGLVASLISLVALDYLFIPPLNAFSFGSNEILRLCIFGAIAALTTSLTDKLKKAKGELELAQEELEERILLRTVELSQANANLHGEIAHRVEAEKTILEISSREQRRLGQDLHDGLCQTLAGVRLFIGELKKQLSMQCNPLSKDVATIESRLVEALTQADTISRGLYPVELETNGLMSALEEMAAKVSKAFPVACRFKCPKPLFVIDSSMATHVYRIAQEAVMNSIKGGKAKRITIRLAARPPRIMLSITDDGVGLHSHNPRKGMGLKIMDYRARVINASLRLRSRSRGWTRVSCSFPLLTEKGENEYYVRETHTP